MSLEVCAKLTLDNLDENPRNLKEKELNIDVINYACTLVMQHVRA